MLVMYSTLKNLEVHNWKIIEDNGSGIRGLLILLKLSIFFKFSWNLMPSISYILDFLNARKPFSVVLEQHVFESFLLRRKFGDWIRFIWMRCKLSTSIGNGPECIKCFIYIKLIYCRSAIKRRKNKYTLLQVTRKFFGRKPSNFWDITFFSTLNYVDENYYSIFIFHSCSFNGNFCFCFHAKLLARRVS